jgi:hypothetical protein
MDGEATCTVTSCTAGVPEGNHDRSWVQLWVQVVLFIYAGERPGAHLRADKGSFMYDKCLEAHLRVQIKGRS